MARLLSILALAGAVAACGGKGSKDGGDDGGPAGDGGTPECAFVSELAAGCLTDVGCDFGIHQTDCCGNTHAVGFAQEERARFDMLEPACQASYPACGCPTLPTTTDSGETALEPSDIQVGCIPNGPMASCMTYVTMRPVGTP